MMMNGNSGSQGACTKPPQGRNTKKYTDPRKSFVDQFVNLANCQEPRSCDKVYDDMYTLWRIDPKLCVKFAVYTRMITRKCRIQAPTGLIQLDTQRGAGLKAEGITRMMWLATYHKPTFNANVPYFAAAGSWKDFITLLVNDVQMHGFKHRLDWEFLKKTIYAGLVHPHSCDLVKKYLPRVKSNVTCKTPESKAKNIVAKFLADGLYGKPDNEGDFSTYRKYRKMKNSGTAMEWQQLISQQKALDIDFETVPGKALALLAGSRFLKIEGLKEKYQTWLTSCTKPITSGFVHELFKPFGIDSVANNIPEYMEASINCSFNLFVDNAIKKNAMPLLVVRDISEESAEEIDMQDVSCYSLGKAYAMYHSALLPSHFQGSYLSLVRDKCEFRKWGGRTPSEIWRTSVERQPSGECSLVSVANTLVAIKELNVSEDKFPKGILVVSSQIANAANSDIYVAFKQCLLEGGFNSNFVKQFRILLWEPNSAEKSKIEVVPGVSNCFHLTGISQNVAGFITGDKRFRTPHTVREVFDNAINQELLNMITVEKDLPKKNASVQK